MNKLFIFVLGAATGSLVTWKLVEAKYKKLADEEIDSVVKYYNDKINTPDENEERNTSIEQPEEPILQEEFPLFTDEERVELSKKMTETIKDLGYSTDEENEGIVKVDLPEERIVPYVIAPEEYGEDGHEALSLMYYADGVLADDNDEIISDPESIVGDALKHFGEYEDDCVHVRDDQTGCDFEILLSEKTFSEVYKGDN